MRVIERGPFNVPPAPDPARILYEGRCGVVYLSEWPNRLHRLIITATYDYQESGTTSELIEVAEPEPGMVIDCRNIDGLVPNVIIEQIVGVNLLTDWNVRLVVSENASPLILQTRHHAQVLPLGVTRIVNGGYTTHSIFRARASGVASFVYEAAAGGLMHPVLFRLSAMRQAGIAVGFYHGVGQAYSTLTPDGQRGYVTEQPRVAATITQNFYIIAGLDYRLEISHSAACPIDVGVDMHLNTSGSHS